MNEEQLKQAAQKLRKVCQEWNNAVREAKQLGIRLDVEFVDDELEISNLEFRRVL